MPGEYDVFVICIEYYMHDGKRRLLYIKIRNSVKKVITNIELLVERGSEIGRSTRLKQ